MKYAINIDDEQLDELEDELEDDEHDEEELDEQLLDDDEHDEEELDDEQLLLEHDELDDDELDDEANVPEYSAVRSIRLYVSAISDRLHISPVKSTGLIKSSFTSIPSYSGIVPEYTTYIGYTAV